MHIYQNALVQIFSTSHQYSKKHYPFNISNFCCHFLLLDECSRPLDGNTHINGEVVFDRRFPVCVYNKKDSIGSIGRSIPCHALCLGVPLFIAKFSFFSFGVHPLRMTTTSSSINQEGFAVAEEANA